MTSPLHTKEKSKITGLRLSEEHLSGRKLAAYCGGDDHHHYSDDRALREGSRVRVAAVADEYRGDWEIEELRCLHCSLEIDDTTALVPDFSVYDSQHVIVANATVTPWPDRINGTPDEYILDEPEIIHSRRNTQTL